MRPARRSKNGGRCRAMGLLRRVPGGVCSEVSCSEVIGCLFETSASAGPLEKTESTLANGCTTFGMEPVDLHTVNGAGREPSRYATVQARF